VLTSGLGKTITIMALILWKLGSKSQLPSANKLKEREQLALEAYWQQYQGKDHELERTHLLKGLRNKLQNMVKDIGKSLGAVNQRGVVCPMQTAVVEYEQWLDEIPGAGFDTFSFFKDELNRIFEADPTKQSDQMQQLGQAVLQPSSLFHKLLNDFEQEITHASSRKDAEFKDLRTASNRLATMATLIVVPEHLINHWKDLFSRYCGEKGDGSVKYRTTFQDGDSEKVLKALFHYDETMAVSMPAQQLADDHYVVVVSTQTFQKAAVESMFPALFRIQWRRLVIDEGDTMGLNSHSNYKEHGARV
jgi:hypothetical protein